MNPIFMGSYLYSADNKAFTSAEIYGKRYRSYWQVVDKFEKWKQVNDKHHSCLERHFERDWTEYWRYLEYIFHPRWRHKFVTRKIPK